MSPRSTRTPFCAERAPQNGGFSLFDVSWFVFLFSLVKTNDDDSDEGKLYFMMETHRSCGMASRGIRYGVCRGTFGLRFVRGVSSTRVEIKQWSNVCGAIEFVTTTLTCLLWWDANDISVRSDSEYFDIYISLHFRYGYSQLSILDEKFIKEKELINHINIRLSENLLLFFKCIATTTTTTTTKNNYL